MTIPAWKSDESKRMVRTLWLEGKSATEIAVLTKAPSRNAVIGMVHRAGLTAAGGATVTRQTMPSKPTTPKPRPVETRAPAMPRPIKAAAPKPSIEPPTPKAAPVKREAPVLALVGKPVMLTDLPSRCACKYPVGGDPGRGNMDRQLFCAEPTGGVDQVYCATHRKVAFTTPTAAKKRSMEARDNVRTEGSWSFGRRIG